MKKRTVSLLLLVAMLAACGETAVPSADTTAAEVTTISPGAAEKRANTADSLPDDLDFGSAEVTIYAREGAPFDYEFGVGSENGEVVNDAIWMRNLAVEERLNVKISVDASAVGTGQASIRTVVLSGDDTYTFCTGTSFHTPALALEDCFVNLLDVEYLDFDKPWWVQNLREEMTLYDQLYFMSGDLTLTLLQYESAIFANQTLLADYGIGEDLYSLVREGKWTLDKLSEFTRMVSADLNGDGVMNEMDRFGLGLCDSSRIMATGYGAGMLVTEKNSEGIPELALNREHTFDVFDKVNVLYRDKAVFNRFNGTYLGKEPEMEVIALQRKMFANDQLLFHMGNIMDTEELRDMRSDYSILPFAKFDEAQENYISYSFDNFSVIVIPRTCPDTDLAGAVCEAMASESYRTVTPAYFDVALKGKYTRDEHAAEMIDLVHATITFNWGLGNSYTMGYVSHIFQNAIENDIAFASQYASRESAAKSGYKSLIEYYRDHQ